jgi:hypothetical protein
MGTRDEKMPVWYPALLILLLLITECTAQSEKSESDKKLKTTPDIQINVNKQTDKNGNIIRYDSTYSYAYSSENTGDSTWAQFERKMNSGNPLFIRPQFLSLFKNDSLFFNSQDQFFRSFKRMNDEMMRSFFENWEMHPPLREMPPAAAPGQNNKHGKKSESGELKQI